MFVGHFVSKFRLYIRIYHEGTKVTKKNELIAELWVLGKSGGFFAPTDKPVG